MFESIKRYIERTRDYNESRRRNMVIGIAVAVFVLVCVGWILTMSSGFADFSGRWISGTRTYTASGTEIYDDGSVSSLRSSWDHTQDRIGSAWDVLMNVFTETSTSSDASSTRATSDYISSSTSPSL